MIFRAMNVVIDKQYDLSFADVKEVSDYSKDAIGYFTANKIINGYEDNTFRPKGNINRAEAAVLIYRITDKEGK